MSRRKSYGLLHFVWDLTLFCLTGGLWGIYLLFKFFHNN